MGVGHGVEGEGSGTGDRTQNLVIAGKESQAGALTVEVCMFKGLGEVTADRGRSILWKC